jgi:PKD repeat protein
MGRPLNKRYFGATSTDIASSPPGDISNEERLTAIVKVGANSVSETGIILSQRSETKFKVDDAADGSGNEGFCTLVDKDVPGNDEMVLKGYIAGDGDGVNIRKVQNRTMIDFDNNRYTWEIQDDSTSNILVLTAI